jgi:putative phosphoserine phosphatase/1-acylglycerol-3-phosphate O-acyltransferase
MAQELGIAHVLCTRLEVENGVFTGRIIRPTCYGEGKATAAHELAARHDIDVGQSWFYTDSDEDLPLLEIVGRPRPTNPNRALAQIAKERRWPVRRFKSRGRPSAGDVLRTGLVYASLAPSVWAGAAAGLVNRSQREATNVMGAVWSDLATSLAGIDLRVEGEQHLWSHRPAVFIFNHQSGLDAMLMLKLLRRDLKAIDALRPAVDALRQGRSLAISPEGTRSTTGRLGRFKKGAFHMAMQGGVPVVPVVFRNVLDALPKVEAVVLPPIDTRHWTPERLDDEIQTLRRQYLEVLDQPEER